MKRIQEEILNRCSSIEAFCAVYYTSTLDPPVGVGTPVYASPLVYKRETLARGRKKSPSWQRIDSFILRAIHLTVDVGYYAPAARTTLNPSVLAFLPPS